MRLFNRGRGEETAEPAVDIAAGVHRALRQSRPAAPDAAAAPKTDVRRAFVVIEQALFALDAIRETLEEACEIALQARDCDDEAGRALLAERYDDLRLSVPELAKEAASKDGDLLTGSARAFDIGLGGAARYTIPAIRMDLGEKGLSLPPPRDAFEEDEEILAVLEGLDAALAKTDRAVEQYCRDATFLAARAELAPGA